MSDNSPQAFAIDDALAERVNTALASSLPMLIAYVNADQQARLSFRGSIFVHGPQQLALWARDPEGGITKGIAGNPKVTVMYRDPAARTTIFFYGRASKVDDAALRDQIYEAIPEPEQKADPDRKGNAIVVDLDQIQGRGPDGPINLVRD